MSADFWAGYASGAVGILIGNPLDLIKVRLQAQPQAQIPSQPLSAEPTLSRQAPIQAPVSASPLRSSSPLLANSVPATSTFAKYFQGKHSLLTGTAAPVLGYGALNAILFVAYNRTEEALNRTPLFQFHTATGGADKATAGSSLWTTWLAGAVGGLATWVISTPTELIKCRAQLAPTHSSESTTLSSYRITQQILRTESIRGLYHGGVVTALRDSIGYGFYFWAYELGGRLLASLLASQQPGFAGTLPTSVGNSDIGGLTATKTSFSTQETLKVLLSGGIAGVVTWASVFPLDVIKTRVQGQIYLPATSVSAVTPLLGSISTKRKGALQITKEAYAEGGARVFFRGLMVCSLRAFVVNAVQWLVYEWIMLELGPQNRDRWKESPP
ncbi:mitochondrial carrier [Poronia punctata]|nr:mitochondrial carrier [Poronia punctata]